MQSYPPCERRAHECHQGRLPRVRLALLHALLGLLPIHHSLQPFVAQLPLQFRLVHLLLHCDETR